MKIILHQLQFLTLQPIVKKRKIEKKEADSNITHLTLNMPMIQGMDLSIHHWLVDWFK